MHHTVKTLTTSALALSLFLGASLDAAAQYSRKDYPSSRTSSRTTTEPAASGSTTATTPSRNSPRVERETVEAKPAPAEVSARSYPRESTSPSRTSSRTTTRGTSAPTQPRYESPPTTVYRRTTTTTRPQRPIGYARVIYYGGLDRFERRNLQARLERRAEEVGQWDYDLDAWEADLYGRDYRRRDRYDPYYGYNTARLLSERELCDWSDRLDDATRILLDREQRLANYENNRYRTRGNGNSNGNGNRGRGRGNGNGNGNPNAGGMCPPGW